LTDYLQAWKLLIVDSAGLFQVKNNYAKSVYIRFLNEAGVVTSQFECVGSFPIIYAYYQLNYRESRLTEVSITFKVDKIEYQDATT
jgi:vancomycin resistance protein YoaR